MSQSVKLKSFEGRAASIPLSSLRLLPELQVREKKEDPDHVEFLAEVINTKKLLPRVKVIYVESGDHVGHLVVDGCHTVRAYIKAGRKKVPCTVRSGTWEEAVYVAAGSNQEHRGLKLTNADKRRAVEMLLGTSYSKWGNEKIGEYIGVSGAFVAKIKDSAPEQTQHSDPRHHQTFNGDDGQNDVDENKKEGRDGKFYSPRRQARTASPPATTSPQSIDGGDWKYVQLAEFLEAEDYIWEALAERKITTAGQLFDALNSGQDPGIQHVDREALRKQVEQFANAKESEPYETPAFDWKKYESSFGPVIRGLEQLTRAFPIPKTEHDLAKDLLTKYLLLFGTWKTEYRGR